MTVAIEKVGERKRVSGMRASAFMARSTRMNASTPAAPTT
jgi:hypothetical protein